MRLIDADELMQEIKSLRIVINKKQTLSESVKETILKNIDTQPTAYDIDKVVEELEKKLSEKKYQHENEDYFVGICDAIEIVKGAR